MSTKVGSYQSAKTGNKANVYRAVNGSVLVTHYPYRPIKCVQGGYKHTVMS
ncbi:hypothetical protein [Marinomonas sp. 2405UD68-3]|uniref:hypothetical protein n=1 Tax=Marinomonas sp. 2405UD68-3 TaxID=3391835 RepID=UPI0039C96D27